MGNLLQFKIIADPQMKPPFFTPEEELTVWRATQLAVGTCPDSIMGTGRRTALIARIRETRH